MSLDMDDNGTAPKTMDMDEWNRKFGGDEGLDPFRKTNGGFEYELNVAYPARIKKASLIKASWGDEQLRLILELQKGDYEDAEIVGESCEHVTLPWQESDSKIPKDKKEVILRMRVDTMKRIYSSAVPSEYAAYHTSKPDPKNARKKIYLDFDGSELTNGKYDERGTKVNERILLKIEELKNMQEGELEELEGALLYIVKKPNDKRPQNPHTNFFVTRPNKLKVFGEDSEATF